MSKSNPIKRIFDLYTSDLSFDEIERLIKRDSAEVYEFFKNDIPKADTSKNKFVRALIFIRSLFNAFLLRLSPARRVFYIASLLMFLIGYMQDQGSYIIFAFVILNIMLAFELADKLLTKNEIEVARKIQSELMPKTPPEIPHYSVSAYYESAKIVGGDYYDIIASPGNGNLNYLIVGDISGKGMPAAVYMVRVQAIIHSLINNYSEIKDIVVKLKNTFDKKLLPEYFLTLAAASVDHEGVIKFCRAGHSPLLHYKSASNSFEEINSKGIGIGLKDNGIFEECLEVKEVKPETDDILCFYTDGVTEMMNLQKNQFGVDRLRDIIRDNASKTPEEIKTALLNSLIRFRGNNNVVDDITFIVIKKI